MRAILLVRATATVLVVALFISGCVGSAEEPSAETSEPVADVSEDDGDDGGPDGPDDQDPDQDEPDEPDSEQDDPASAGAIDGPITATYAGVAWTVHDARITDEPPESGDPDDATYLYLDIEVENTLESTSLSFPRDLFAVRHEAGEVSRSEGLLTDDLDSSIEVEPGEVTSGELVFVLESDDVEVAELTLRIAESGKVPAILPLVGEPPVPHPADADISGDLETVTSSTVGDVDVDVEPLEAAVGLDRGSRRSDEGTFFVFVVVRAHGLTDAGGGTVIDADMFRLEVDGVPRSPDDVDGTGLLREGEAIDLRAAFSVPQDVGELTLLVGDPDGDRARYPVRLR